MTPVPLRPARIRRAYFIVAAVVVAALIAASLTGFVWARKSILVVSDGRPIALRTEAADVATLLRQAAVPLSRGDFVNPAPDATLRDGDIVVVRHAIPVTLVLGPARVPVRVLGSRVSDALVAAGLDPTGGMKVSPDIGAPLTAGMTITATDVFLRVVSQEVTIPPHARTVADPSMPINTRRVVTAGVPGKLLRVLETIVTGGHEGGKMLKAVRVVRQPVDVVIAVGTSRDFRVTAARYGFGPQAAPTMPPPAAGRRMTVLATAYRPHDNALEGGFTAATGARLGYGIIAVDPDVIPLGTRLYVPGYGYGIAADTGGAINGQHIDLCFDTASEVNDWGVRTLSVILLP